MKRVIWVVVVVLIAAGGFAAYRSRGRQEKLAYRTEPVARGDVTMTVTATGTLSAVTTVQVGSQVSGIIARLYADFNSRVKQGQLLAELDPTNYQAQVEQRRADLAQSQVQMRNAEVNFTRQQRLLADGLTAQGDYDTAKANFDGAKAVVEQNRAALSQSETMLRYTKILSPIDGVVVDRQYDIGQTVAASFQAPTLFTIAQDLTRMQVQADVDQSDIGRVQIGQSAKFTVDAYPDQTFRGRITQIRLNATVSQNVITYPVIIEVPNPDERLRPKMTADITIEVAKVENVLKVANAALRFRPPENGENGRTAVPAAREGGRPTGAAPGEAARSGAAGAPAEARGGQPGAASGADDRHGGGRETAHNQQTVYTVGPTGTLKAVPIKTGITDGRSTEVVSGDLKEGEAVVTGSPTSKAEQSGSRPPGMRF